MSFKRLLKYCLYSLVFVSLVVAGLFVFLYVKYPPSYWQAELSRQLSESLGVKVTLGEISYSYNLSLAVKDVKIYETRKQKKIMVSAGLVKLHIHPAALWQRRLHFFLIRASDTQIYGRRRGRRLNLLALKPKKRSADSVKLQIDRLKIDGAVNWRAGTLPEGNYTFSFSESFWRNINLKIKEKKSEISLEASAKKSLLNEKDGFTKLLQGKLAPGKYSLQAANISGRWLKSFSLPAGYSIKTASITADGGSQGPMRLKAQLVGARGKTSFKINGAFNYNRAEGRLVNRGVVKINLGKLQLKAQKLLLSKGELADLQAGVAAPADYLVKKATGQLEGRIQIRKSRLSKASLRLKNFKTSLIRAKLIQLRGNESALKIKPAAVKVLGLEARVGGTVLPAQNRLQLDINMAKLDLEKLFASLSAPGAGSTFKVGARLKVARLVYHKWQLADLSAALQLGKAGFQLKGLRAGLGGGQLTGEYKLAKARHSFKLNLRGIRLQKLGATITQLPKAFGTLSATLTGQSQGLQPEKIRQNLQFNLRASVSAGKLVNSGLQKYLGSALGPLHDKLVPLQFRAIEAEVSQKQGQVFIRKARFSSDNLKLSLLGKLNWQLKGDLAATLRFNQRFIQDVATPYTLGISNTRLGEWYTLPIACRGSISSRSCWRKQW